MKKISAIEMMTAEMARAGDLEQKAQEALSEAQTARKRAQSFGILASRVPVWILYQKEGQDEGEARLIEPEDLFESEEGYLMVKAFCRKRKAMRTFRLDRMRGLKVAQ